MILVYKEVSRIFRKIVKITSHKKISHYIFSFLPIRKNVIFFESHRGMSYSDNPKAICEIILSRKLPIQCVWSVKDLSFELPDGVKKVKRFSFYYYYNHACAKMLVNSGEFSQNLRIGKNQVYLNTQHGTPLKLMGIDVKNHKLKNDAKLYSKDARWKYLLSPNPYTTEIFRRAYVYSGNILEAGYPRNDILFTRNNEVDINLLKAKYNIPHNKKIVLYAPTWRDSEGDRVGNRFKLKLDLVEMLQSLGESYIIILRMHHLEISGGVLDKKFHKSVFEFSDQKYDIQELMIISDVLITDYSSVMFDFSILWRPIIFYTYDLEDYSKDIRGVYFDLEIHAPGPVVKSSIEVVNLLMSIEDWFPKFLEKRTLFHAKFCSLENGLASNRVIEEIIEPEMGLSMNANRASAS